MRTTTTTTCCHTPPCPGADADCPCHAHVLTRHHEQGWVLLCNGVILFDDGGAILPNGRTLAPIAA